MVVKLSDLTTDDFINLICGEVEILSSGSQTHFAVSKAEDVRNLILEYRAIADPSSMKQFLTISEEIFKARLEMSAFSICSSLADMKQHCSARTIMTEYGVNAMTMDDQRLEAEITSRLERAKRTIEGLLDEDSNFPSPEQIRKEFDGQTASMMAHFKFQIDTSSMKVPLYAHLVARFNSEQKAQRNALKKKR